MKILRQLLRKCFFPSSFHSAATDFCGIDLRVCKWFLWGVQAGAWVRGLMLLSFEVPTLLNIYIFVLDHMICSYTGNFEVLCLSRVYESSVDNTLLTTYLSTHACNT